jgi:UDP-N-acetylmuramate dehydrogenase
VVVRREEFEGKTGPMQVRENVPLAPLTTFGIGGPARWLTEAGSEEEVGEAVRWARERQTPIFVLGGGSNLLVSDAGFDGLVLQMGLKGLAQHGEHFRVASGEDWDGFVTVAVERGYQGVECLAGIPGSVGGTPVQNVGAYGQEVSTSIERVRAFDTAGLNFVEFSSNECRFGYRKSRFNGLDRGRYIVTRVDYRLKQGALPQVTYADLKLHFRNRGNGPSLSETAAAVRKIRQGKGMLYVEGDADCRSAGSFFKNPEVSAETAANVRKNAIGGGISLRVYPVANGMVKVPAAWLIEHAGFSRGYTRGTAGISTRHTLALTNRGGASAADVMALAEEIQAGVETKFGIRLEMEPVRRGF